MNKRNLENRRLDEIGRKLLETGGIQSDELERIVSAPNLFDDIKARIRTEQAANSKKVSVERSGFSFWTWPRAGTVFAGLAVLMLAVFGLSFYTGQTPAVIEAVNEVPQNEAPATAATSAAATTGGERPLQVSVTTPPPAGAEAEPEFKPSNLIYREESNKPALKEFRKTRSSQKTKTEAQPEEEFYPLTYTGNMDEVTFGAHVVRVDLPRSSLLAMGVDLPGGNGADTIKTDLLISPDGVTKGFRFVK